MSCRWTFNVFKIHPLEIAIKLIFIVLDPFKISAYSGDVTQKAKTEPKLVIFSLLYFIYSGIVFIIGFL